MKAAEPGPVASAGHLPSRRERVHALCVLLASVLVRLCVGLLPYSGHARPPRYGDYEAQRHWMEVTLHLPASEWYRNSTSNPMDWWGLDYPPLSAYQSWLYGQVLHAAEPESVALLASHGYESPGSKRLMRWTVVASELAFFVPPALAAATAFTAGGRTRHQAAQRLWLLFCLLLQPAALLIDHAHFQYNHISLGLALGGAAAVAADYDILGSVLFTLSLQHKQMNMYYGPAFFAHLLGKCLRSGGLPAKAAAVARLGLTVLATFALVWAPLGLGFGQAGAPSFQPAGILAAAKRLVPIQRGLFEDYVGNVWCLLHVAGLKLKHRLATGTLLKLCSSCTLLAAAPAMLHQMLRPSRTGLLYCMACTASAFFLFSFQVHEKSILLPLLPVTALAAREPMLARWMPLLAAFSMFPLLKKDGAVLPYAALLPAYWLLSSAFLPPAAPAGSQTSSRSVSSRWPLPRFLLRLLTAVAEEVVTAMGLAGADLVTDAVPLLSLLGMATLHAAAWLLPPPASLPFLYDAAITSYACLHFVAIYVYLTLRLWSLPRTARQPTCKGS